MLPSIEIRVTRTLDRLGFSDVRVRDLGDGLVQLSGRTANPDDEAMVIAAARTVQGVKEVDIMLQFRLYGD